MMNQLTPNDVISPPINEKEDHHCGRNRLSNHVYLSRYLYECKLLHGKDQYTFVAQYLGDNNVPGDASIDSTDTPILYSVSHTDVMRVACFN